MQDQDSLNKAITDRIRDIQGFAQLLLDKGIEDVLTQECLDPILQAEQELAELMARRSRQRRAQARG